MKIKLLAVGTKMPDWVNQGFIEYSKRLPRELSFEVIEIPLAIRSKNSDISRAIEKESSAILAQLNSNDHVIALEVEGLNWSTEKLATHMESWLMNGQNICLLVGGPDGLSDACRARANQQWSLSALTLPHPIVRVLLAEQIYRAWSVTQNHPYHRS